jgi:hypothetical protein
VERPVTLEAGQTVAVRVREGDGPVANVVLERSKAEGPPRQVVTDRRYLLRALQLGFTEVLIDKPQTPLCVDARRSYLWMPLSGGEPVAGPAKPQPLKEGFPAPAPTAAPPEPVKRNPSLPANEPRPVPLPAGTPLSGYRRVAVGCLPGQAPAGGSSRNHGKQGRFGRRSRFVSGVGCVGFPSSCGSTRRWV